MGLDYGVAELEDGALIGGRKLIDLLEAREEAGGLWESGARGAAPHSVLVETLRTPAGSTRIAPEGWAPSHSEQAIMRSMSSLRVP